MVKRWSVAAMLGLATSVALPRAATAQTERVVEAPIIDPSWLQADTVTKTATFQLVAGLTGLNGALNFNGFRDGGLSLTVPLGWNVVLHFRNHDGMLPHSTEVIPDTHPLPTGPVAPAFARAMTVRLEQGLISEQTDDIRFIADKGGSYLICEEVRSAFLSVTSRRSSTSMTGGRSRSHSAVPGAAAVGALQGTSGR